MYLPAWLFTPTSSPPSQHWSNFKVLLLTYKRLFPTLLLLLVVFLLHLFDLVLLSVPSPCMMEPSLAVVRLYNSLPPPVDSSNKTLGAHLYTHNLTKLPSTFTLLIVVWQDIILSNFCWIIYLQNQVQNESTTQLSSHASFYTGFVILHFLNVMHFQLLKCTNSDCFPRLCGCAQTELDWHLPHAPVKLSCTTCKSGTSYIFIIGTFFIFVGDRTHFLAYRSSTHLQPEQRFNHPHLTNNTCECAGVWNGFRGSEGCIMMCSGLGLDVGVTVKSWDFNFSPDSDSISK